ncbi:MAG: mechanosensitive ion channel [Bradymonadales bacterium]|nr:mechanosensitive ion channel [Bradymonadales bacterium]
MIMVFEDIYAYLLTYGMRLVAAIIIFVIGKWVAKLLARMIERLLVRAKVEQTLASFTRHIAYFGLILVVIIAGLNKLGVETTSLVALIGAAGLAIGLALQGSLANFAASIMLVLFKPFKVGDFVEAGGDMGVVQEIQLFNTVLTTMDNRRVVIPNSKVTGDNITNYTSQDKRRIDLVFSISYGDDINTAKEALSRVVSSEERILAEPETVIAVSELADSGVHLVCRPWVKPADYWPVRFELLERGKLALEDAGLTIPFPQQDVHLVQPGSGLQAAS